MDKNTLKLRIIFRRIIEVFIILSIFVMAVHPMNYENDVFWQIRMGEHITKTHSFPVKDIYSSTAYGQTWTLHEWIPSVIFYFLFSSFGPTGLILFKAVLVSLIFVFFMFLFNKFKANLYLTLIFFVLAVFVNTRGSWIVFPSIFEYLFLTITLILLEIYREKRSRIIPVVLPFLSLLWANCHASFFLLPGIAGAYLLGDIAVEKLRGRLKWYKPDGPYLNRDSRIWLLVSIIFSLVAPVFTPNGLDTYIYPFKISFGKFTNYVTEYQHFWSVWTWKLSDLDLAFTFILMVSLWGIFIINFKKLHPTDFILGTTFTFMALTAIRHEAIFALVAMFLITKFISRRFGEYRGIFKRTLIRDILVIILLICFVYYFKTQISGFGFGLDESGYPKAAADLINDSNLAGNMFNHYNYGGYLIWKTPDYPVFIDGRLEMYEGQIGKDYMDILEGKEGYQSLLDKYKINFFLINSNEMIVEKLVYDDNWKIVFSDGRYLVFVKNVPQNADFLKEHWSRDTEDTFRENYKNALAESRAQIYTNQGIDAFKSGNIEYAIQNFKAVVILAPESVEARLNLAEAYFRAGLYTDAGGEYDYIIQKLDPGNQKAKTALKIISEYEKK